MSWKDDCNKCATNNTLQYVSNIHCLICRADKLDEMEKEYEQLKELIQEINYISINENNLNKAMNEIEKLTNGIAENYLKQLEDK